MSEEIPVIHAITSASFEDFMREIREEILNKDRDE